MSEQPTTAPVEVRFTPWTTPAAIFRSDSADAIETGRHHLFDPVECCRMGRCS